MPQSRVKAACNFAAGTVSGTIFDGTTVFAITVPGSLSGDRFEPLVMLEIRGHGRKSNPEGSGHGQRAEVVRQAMTTQICRKLRRSAFFTTMLTS